LDDNVQKKLYFLYFGVTSISLSICSERISSTVLCKLAVWLKKEKDRLKNDEAAQKKCYALKGHRSPNTSSRVRSVRQSVPAKFSFLRKRCFN